MPDDARAKGRDIVVMGASAGGIDPLIVVLSNLDPKLQVAVFVVVHRSGESPSTLAKLLARATALRVVEVEAATPIVHGTVYLAPAGRHMLVKHGHVQVTRGPKENRHRPAVDPLFRSAAWAYGPRVVGVLLSGRLSDGAAGLWAIRSCGGVVIIQSPAEAKFAAMPRNALETLDPDHCVPAEAIGPLITSLAGTPIARSHPVPAQVVLESQMAELRNDDIRHVSRIGTLSPFTCPACHGSLWEIDDSEVLRFRCHTGHAFSAEALVEGISDSTEEALYSAVRSLQETVAMYQRIANRERGSGRDKRAASFEARAHKAQMHATAIARLLQYGIEVLPEEPGEQKQVREGT
jgi:two-component system chemotaxis response regulator CheB